MAIIITRIPKENYHQSELLISTYFRIIAERLTSLLAAQSAFRTAICDSFNTPASLDVLRDLVSRTNVYINSRGKNLNVGLVENIARWIGKMLRVFGLGEGESTEIGWGQDSQGETSVNVCASLLFSIS